MDDATQYQSGQDAPVEDVQPTEGDGSFTHTDNEGNTLDSAPASDEPTKSGVPGVGEAELPELDPETRLGVDPIPAMPRNPGLDYDDEAAGKPDDATE